MEKEENIFESITDVGQAEEIFNYHLKDHPNELKSAEKLLNTLLNSLSKQPRLVGDADDFHNFAVSISRTLSDSNAAYYIVYKGLDIHPSNTDLLADAIQYGYSCGEKNSCNKYFEKLSTIDKSRWTWRAFSFSIEYLLQEWVSSDENKYNIDDIIQLAKDYQKYMPYEEDAWYSEYEIYAGVNQREKSLEILEEAIKKFKFCPKCWLRYADMMIDESEFEKAEPILKNMRKNPRTREHINISYMYFLEAQCKMAAFRSTEEYENGKIEEKAVWSIYQSFRQSLVSKGLKESLRSRIDEYISEIYAESNIPFPQEWRRT